jgi:hypothetical protein
MAAEIIILALSFAAMSIWLHVNIETNHQQHSETWRAPDPISRASYDEADGGISTAAVKPAEHPMCDAVPLRSR